PRLRAPTKKPKTGTNKWQKSATVRWHRRSPKPNKNRRKRNMESITGLPGGVADQITAVIAGLDFALMLLVIFVSGALRNSPAFERPIAIAIHAAVGLAWGMLTIDDWSWIERMDIARVITFNVVGAVIAGRKFGPYAAKILSGEVHVPGISKSE